MPRGISLASRIRRAAVGVAVAVVLIAVIQRFAPDTDYQFAFLASAAVALIAVTFALYQLHRIMLGRGHPWWTPAAVGGLLLLGVTLLRFQTFSGEMVPQFEWRFARREAPPLVTELAAEPGRAVAADAGQLEADAQGAAGLDTGDEAVASITGDSFSPGFLGPDRNGVFPNRRFALPQSIEDVEVLWNIGIGQGWGSFAVAENLAVTLEQRGRRECVTAYRLADGALKWIHERGAHHESALGGVGPRSTPTVDDGRVYVQGASGHVRCLHLASGELLWELDLLELAGWSQEQSETAISWGRAGSPLLVEGLCVLPFGAPSPVTSLAPALSPSTAGETSPEDRGGRSLIAIDAASGKVRWTAGKDQISYASPQLLTLADERQIVIVNEKTITGHAIDSGQTLWSFPWPGQSNAAANCASVVPAGSSQFLIGKGYGGGSALVNVSRGGSGETPFTATAVWTSNRLLQTKFNHACVDGDVAYAIGNGALEAVHLTSQELLWKQSRRERSGQGQPLLAGDVLVVQSESGEVLFVDADPTEYRRRFRLEGLSSKTWNIPTLAGRMLLIRNDQQAIAYRLPAPP